MSQVFYISDHHFNHKSILKFEPAKRQGTTVAEHNEWLIAQHNKVVGKNDVTWFGGDVCFEALVNPAHDLIERMNGRKNLLLGNHDQHMVEHYRHLFGKIYASLKVHNVIVTHIPVHPDEFSYRADYNLHGHIHGRDLVHDERYVNMCVEHCEGTPRTLDQWIPNRKKAAS